MTDNLRDPLLAVMNLPTHRETLFGMAEGPALYEGQRLYLKRSEVLVELAAALAAAPQPAPERSELDALRKVNSELIRENARLIAAPQPAPDREELVRLLRIITRNGSLDDGRTLHEIIADALLARGLRLPGGDETMAWGVVDKHGNLDPHTIYPDEWMADRKVDPGERLVRVAIRVVEGGDDE